MLHNLIQKAYAADTDKIIDQFTLRNVGGVSSITKILDIVINLATGVAGTLAFFYLVYSGILYLTASGNPDAAKKGQQGIINSVIGIVVIVFSFVIIKVVAHTLLVDVPTPTT